MDKMMTRSYRDLSTRQALLILLAIFSVSLCCLSLVYYNFPKLDPSEREHLKLPWNMEVENIKRLGPMLSKYKDKYFVSVLTAFIVTYVFLQSFALPGSIFLSILSGFIFPLPLALFCVCWCSAVGASICYFLSYLLGRRVVHKIWPVKMHQLSSQVDRHKENLLYYIIFLRITPLLPNWFINIASPQVDVPLKHFFVGTFLGVAPMSYAFIHAGTTIQKLTSIQDIMSPTLIISLIGFAVISLLPILFQKMFQKKFN